MKIYDISMKISGDMPVYKGRAAKKPLFRVESDFTSGSVYETRIDMNMHTGTHIDSPAHILPGGKTIDTLDLSRVVTKCRVLDLQYAEEQITAEHLAAKKIGEGDFVLLKTKNSFFDLLEGRFVFLDRTGAQYLTDRKICGVGIDSLGIERDQHGHETHKLLLGSDIVIIEGLRLKDIPEGEYLLVAAPLSIAGAEAAPARAILID